MPQFKLLDQSVRSVDHPIALRELAAMISPSLAKKALAAKVDGALYDLSRVLDQDATVQFITAQDPEGLEVLRHSAAHLLAQAVQRLFPDVQVTIGPVIEDGFYYDFAAPRPFTPDDLLRIEKEMKKIAEENLSVARHEWSRDRAIACFSEKGELYKVEIIQEIPAGETLSVYQQGEFLDLCRGPHVPSTGHLRAFKLMKQSGAYWRGDCHNAVLQRIYGTAWPDQKALDQYLFRLEEAEKRDHRKLAMKMDLCHWQEEGPGMVFWHPNGWQLNQTIRQYIAAKQRESGYQEVNTPIILDARLWEQSGHAQKYAANMFLTASENRDYAIKPMNCPCHVQIFKQGLKSYRDLPIRYSEFGCCHRNEASGTLHGLMRVRGFVQDDGHIFCTVDQVAQEAAQFIAQLYAVYKDFGFEDVLLRLSTRPAERVGEDHLWDQAEKALASTLNHLGLSWQENAGEGAFYGPKIEFSLRDCLGRVWQCGTLQLDFFIPQRLGATYVGEDNAKHTPVLLHRAIFGSLERFIGILIEHYAGWLPLWLAPVQVVIMSIGERQRNYAQEITEKLKKRGFRAQSDLRNEKIGFKIREHMIARVPYQVVLGEREIADQQVAVRVLRQGEVVQQLQLSVDAFIQHLNEECGQSSGAKAN